jgi:Gamma tubulin complex component C-terminal
MKTFFLLDQSDYLTHFLDVALDHLIKPASEVSLQKLNSLLELVVRTPSTVASADPYKEDLVVELSSLSLFEQLTRINSMVGIDMKKHLQNMRAGKSFEVSNSLATPEPNNYAGIKAGKLTGTFFAWIQCYISHVFGAKQENHYQIPNAFQAFV